LDQLSELSAGDLLWLETPINPFGTHFDIQMLAKQAHELGVVVGVDATFAPPPLMDPFKWGADYVMHSATKYLGGHSDLLAGIIVAKDAKTHLKVSLHITVLTKVIRG
jgi:cystathionine beta-lyase/cystathionine gamma-synthase